MRRGEIWTVSGGKDYAGKPRPAVIIQEDAFDATDSITICAFTSDETEAPLFRLPVEPDKMNGLRQSCRLMVDKITRHLADEDILRLNRAILVFLGLTAAHRAARSGH
ncbi:type II toxin-antitoxin system PemK/MazF family toxin [Rhodomicrobium lacus]|uniref:type II toxin-antitoxin system PemK/MazF family toxin n=1 Tax=Rhodomicrobium lacus TaxID=2498452 RepID=UPI000F8C695F|nr:type II toxin-antitoxin system PemK/MazF family toxin [Rhodomicrobium lacus]